jgi:hypothetical protein
MILNKSQVYYNFRYICFISHLVGGVKDIIGWISEKKLEGRGPPKAGEDH